MGSRRASRRARNVPRRGGGERLLRLGLEPDRIGEGLGRQLAERCGWCPRAWRPSPRRRPLAAPPLSASSVSMRKPMSTIGRASVCAACAPMWPLIKPGELVGEEPHDLVAADDSEPDADDRQRRHHHGDELLHFGDRAHARPAPPAVRCASLARAASSVGQRIGRRLLFAFGLGFGLGHELLHRRLGGRQQRFGQPRVEGLGGLGDFADPSTRRCTAPRPPCRTAWRPGSWRAGCSAAGSLPMAILSTRLSSG